MSTCILSDLHDGARASCGATPEVSIFPDGTKPDGLALMHMHGRSHLPIRLGTIPKMSSATALLAVP